MLAFNMCNERTEMCRRRKIRHREERREKNNEGMERRKKNDGKMERREKNDGRMEEREKKECWRKHAEGENQREGRGSNRR